MAREKHNQAFPGKGKRNTGSILLRQPGLFHNRGCPPQEIVRKPAHNPPHSGIGRGLAFHMIRDVKFLVTLPDKKQQAYGKRVRGALRELFPVIHRRDKMSAVGFAKAMQAAREDLIRVATTRVPKGKHARNLAKRFRQHGEAYFRFITTPGIEPTNNLAEQAIRFVVIDRRITQRTRSETGRCWCERIWTTIAACAPQGRSVFEFLLASIESHLRGAPPPLLLPSGT